MGQGEGEVLCLDGSSRSLIRGGLGGREVGCSLVRVGAGAMVLPRLPASMHEGIREGTLLAILLAVVYQSILANIIVSVLIHVGGL